MTDQEQNWMQRALALASYAEQQGEVPIGAVLIQDNQLIAEGWNQPINQNDCTAHAEIVALRQAGQKMKNYRLPNTTLFVTLEPCAMCAGALIQARIECLVFGAYDKRAGAVTSVFKIIDEPELNHSVQWKGGVMQQACADILQKFFKQRR